MCTIKNGNIYSYIVRGMNNSEHVQRELLAIFIIMHMKFTQLMCGFVHSNK